MTNYDMNELERLERTDTLPAYAFTYQGHDGRTHRDILCAACLSRPECSAVYADDDWRTASVHWDGETELYHRRGDQGYALRRYVLDCSLCGERIAEEETQEHYFARERL